MKNIIIIPTYKEQEQLRFFLPRLQEHLGKNDIVLLIDGSENFETRQFVSLKDNIYAFPRWYKKRGFCKAVKRGLSLGLFAFEGDNLITMDCDHAPSDIKKFLNLKEDFAIGYEEVKDYRPMKRVVSKGLCSLLGINVKHPTCGFRMYSKNVINSMDFDKIGCKGFFVQIELLWRVYRAKWEIKQIPIQQQLRKYGKSKLGFKMLLDWLNGYFKLLAKHFYLGIRSIIKG